jgi:hypothetical protein
LIFKAYPFGMLFAVNKQPSMEMRAVQDFNAKDGAHGL